MELMIRTGVLKVALKQKWLPLVAAQTIHFKRQLKRFQSFQLKSRFIYWDEKFFYIEHIFSRRGKLIAAAALAKGWFLGNDGVFHRLSVFEMAGRPYVSPAAPEQLKDWEEI